MENSDNNWDKFYRKLNLIFHGIVASSLIPFAFVYLETQKEYAEDLIINGQYALVIKVLLVTMSAAILGYSRIYQKRLGQQITKDLSLDQKLAGYLSLKLRGYLLLESAAVVALTGLYLTQDQLFTFVYLLALFIFSLGRPSYDRIVRELVLSKSEQEKLRTGDF